MATGSSTARAQTAWAPAVGCPNVGLAGQAQCPAPPGSCGHLIPVMWALSVEGGMLGGGGSGPCPAQGAPAAYSAWDMGPDFQAGAFMEVSDSRKPRALSSSTLFLLEACPSYLNSALAAALFTGANFSKLSRNPRRWCYLHGTKAAQSYVLSGVAGISALVVFSFLHMKSCRKRKASVRDQELGVCCTYSLSRSRRQGRLKAGRSL